MNQKSSPSLSSSEGANNFQEKCRKTLNSMKKGLASLKQSFKLIPTNEHRDRGSFERLATPRQYQQSQRTPTLNAHRQQREEIQCGCLDFQSSLFLNSSNSLEPMDVKVLLLGANNVGKSALSSQFIKGEFIDVYHPTIEDQFKKTLTVDGKQYMLHILDSSGSVLLKEEEENDHESVASQYTNSTSTLDDETKVSNFNTVLTGSFPAESSSFSSLPAQCVDAIENEERIISTEENPPTQNVNTTLNTSQVPSEFMQKCLRDSIISHISPKPKSKRISLNPETIFASNVIIFLVYSISDHSSFESVVQRYEELKQLVIESQLIKYFKDQDESLSNRSSLRAFLSSSKRSSFNYSFQPTIMLVGTKKDHDTSVKSLSELNISNSPGSFGMHGFYYGFGHSNSSSYDLPASLPIYGPSPISRKPSIYSQFEYSLCGVSENKRQVSYDEGEQYQQSLGENCLFMEVSCQNPLDVEQVFLQACRKVRSRTIELDNSDHAHAFRSKTVKNRAKIPTFDVNKESQ
ncbi:ras family small GTPase [Naegleria gruberi]|uniref:Ras family small GTPase n=1 Tax=Naegleria gruberi TaxID=5762 RepID=D2VBG1_NAEGR|nr:ras family small GTPase [Naegleria gruberi]EFC45902.1 ras family small GTPase [Naegleria gruberi]|eukprot:XP_002678646.1 ras family small GTPase [Naegleria gruberi strain NEG-M]